MENQPITIKKIWVIWPVLVVIATAAMAWANSVNKIEALTTRMTKIEENYAEMQKSVTKTAEDVAFIRGLLEKKK